MTETFEPVDFSNVHEGDRVQFVTNENGYGGRGWYERTGAVVKVTEKTVRVECDDAPTRVKRDVAVLRRNDWHPRSVRKAATEQPARRPYNAENVRIVDAGVVVTAVWCSDPTVDPAVALENILHRDLPYEVEVIAEASWFFKNEGAYFSGWVVGSSDPIPNKREALRELRRCIADHFTRD
jgi:hypothetical protein